MRTSLKARAALPAVMVLAGAWLPCAQASARALAVQLTVICQDASVAAHLSAAVNGALQAEGYVQGRPWPAVRLIVYAQQNINNRKNPHGWSIAVAHADLQLLQMAALRIVRDAHPAPGGDTGRLVAALIHSSGALTYLNIINVDHLDDHDFPLLAGSIVNAFLKRWPPGGAVAPKPLPGFGRSFPSPPNIVNGPSAKPGR